MQDLVQGVARFEYDGREEEEEERVWVEPFLVLELHLWINLLHNEQNQPHKEPCEDDEEARVKVGRPI